MSELKAGMIACIKTTAEPVYVLDIKPLTGGYHVLAGILSGVMAKVRRPMLNENGAVTHVIEDFFVEELETKEENAVRSVQEMEALKAQFKAGQNAEASNKLAFSN